MSWVSKKLGDVATLMSGGTPRKSNDSYWGGDIPWVSSKNLKSFYLYDSLIHVTEEGAKNGTRLVPENTVLFVVRGMSLANEFRVSLTKLPVTFNQDLKALKCNDGVDSRFVFYSLVAQRDRIRQMAGEASHGTKKLPTDVVNSIPIKIPDLPTQKKIVAIAEKYDFLIENNRRRIELLEESSRLLYREWFVHLRFPGHERTKITDGVPDGWKRKTISEVADTFGGGTPSTKVSQYWDDGCITWFAPKDLSKNNSLVLLESEKKISEIGLKKSSAKMIPPETILMSSRASIGYFGIYENECCTNQGFISSVPKLKSFRMYLLHNLIHRVEEIKGMAGGTTYKEISKSVFRAMPIVVPSPQILFEFEEYAYSIIKQTRVLMKQNKKLNETKELLLPRLMSGDVDV